MNHGSRNSVSENTEVFKFIYSICKDCASISTPEKNMAVQ